MVERGRDCSEVLIQLSAVKAALNNLEREILKLHLDHILTRTAESGKTEGREEMNRMMDSFLK